jgi:hypothetical protein
MPTHSWEVRVRGPVSPQVLADIGAMCPTAEPPQMLLTTEPLDQAGLHGLLERLRNLGLDIVEIRASLENEPDSPE